MKGVLDRKLCNTSSLIISWNDNNCDDDNHEDKNSSHCFMKLYVAGLFHASLSYEIFFCN